VTPGVCVQGQSVVPTAWSVPEMNYHVYGTLNVTNSLTHSHWVGSAIDAISTKNLISWYLTTLSPQIG